MSSPPVPQAAFVQRVLIVAAIVALALLLWAWRDVFLLAFGAALIAVGLLALAEPLRRYMRLPARWALALACVIVLGVGGGLSWVFGSQIVNELSVMIERLPEAWARLKIDLFGNALGAALAREVDGVIAGGGALGQSGSLLSRLGGYTMTFVTAATETLLVIFAAIYFAAAPDRYREGLLALIPGPSRAHVREAAIESGRALRRWLLGTLVSMLVVGVLMTAGLMVLGVPAPLALGLITGLAQFVPLVGPLLSAVPAILLGLSVSPETALWTFALHFSIMQLESNLIFPLIQQRAVSLPPALTLFAVVAMGLLFGALGVLLATPLALVMVIFVKRLYVRDTLHQTP